MLPTLCYRKSTCFPSCISALRGERKRCSGKTLDPSTDTGHVAAAIELLATPRLNTFLASRPVSPVTYGRLTSYAQSSRARKQDTRLAAVKPGTDAGQVAVSAELLAAPRLGDLACNAAGVGRRVRASCGSALSNNIRRVAGRQALRQICLLRNSHAQSAHTKVEVFKSFPCVGLPKYFFLSSGRS